MMKPREGDMTLTEALRLLNALDISVGLAEEDCDCEYCMSEKMEAINKAKRIIGALYSLGFTPPEPVSNPLPV